MDLISSSYYNQDSDEKNMNALTNLESKNEPPFYLLREAPGKLSFLPVLFLLCNQ